MTSPVPTPTVAFSVRNLRADLRDRLHALAAIRESQTGQRITLTAMLNEALARGVETLEAEALGPAAAAKIKAKSSP